jgi:hypothetical protein
LQVLLVAHRRVHLTEQRHARAGLDGNGKARAGHQRAQADAGEGDGFTAGVRARDDQAARVEQFDVVGDDFEPALEHQPRVAQPAQHQRPVDRLDRGHRGRQVGRQPSDGLELVELRRCVQAVDNPRAFAAHEARQLEQYFAFFLEHQGQRDGQLVADADQLGGLDEERLAGLAGVVHDAGNVALVGRLDRHHVAVVAH